MLIRELSLWRPVLTLTPATSWLVAEFDRRMAEWKSRIDRVEHPWFKKLSAMSPCRLLMPARDYMNEFRYDYDAFGNLTMNMIGQYDRVEDEMTPQYNYGMTQRNYDMIVRPLLNEPHETMLCITTTQTDEEVKKWMPFDI